MPSILVFERISAAIGKMWTRGEIARVPCIDPADWPYPRAGRFCDGSWHWLQDDGTWIPMEPEQAEAWEASVSSEPDYLDAIDRLSEDIPTGEML